MPVCGGLVRFRQEAMCLRVAPLDVLMELFSGLSGG